MQVLLIMAITFALCFLVDQGFTKLFRSNHHHKSGLRVRLSKRYAIFGLILTVVGVLAFLVGLSQSWPLSAGGVLLVCFGIALAVYYVSFGVYYDGDSFLVSQFGKKSVAHAYREIRGQKRYVIQGGSVVVELHLLDGSALQLQSTMEGMQQFLNHAYDRWIHQTGRAGENGAFYNPERYCWFPDIETEE